MFRWIRLFDKQYFGFWLLGLLLFLVQEIPYMLMPLLQLEKNPIMHMQESSVILERCEKILGSVCIALMMFAVHEEADFFSLHSGRERLFFGLAMGTLLLNFFGWFLYFAGHQTLAVMMIFIVALPPLFYVFIGLWRNNPALAVMGLIFEAVHFTHVFCNLKMG